MKITYELLAARLPVLALGEGGWEELSRLTQGYSAIAKSFSIIAPTIPHSGETALLISLMDNFYALFFVMTADGEKSNNLIEMLAARARINAKSSPNSITQLFTLYANYAKYRLEAGDAIDGIPDSVDSRYPSAEMALRDEG